MTRGHDDSDEAGTQAPRARVGPTSDSSRHAIAMWDFSWLVRREGDENEYAEWGRVLDEAVERGYDVLRIDAFPHLIAPGRDGAHRREAVILAQRRRFMWGNHRPVRVRPAEALVAFVAAAAERGISVGLSTWFVADELDRRQEVVTPEDYARVWTATLSLLDDAGLLGQVRWVDLCNEFPLDVWAWGAAPSVFGQRLATPAQLALRPLLWPRRAQARLQAYFDNAIAPLRERWPQLAYTFSMHSLAGDQMRALDPANLDLADAHVWLTDSAPWSAATGQVLALAEAPAGVRVHAALAGRLAPRRTRAWRSLLERLMQPWATWARANDLRLYTTEGWGPTNYADLSAGGAEWSWVRSFSADAVELALEHGWTGVCTSNFAQPHHRGMWADAAWHRDLTRSIRAP